MIMYHSMIHTVYKGNINSINIEKANYLHTGCNII